MMAIELSPVLALPAIDPVLWLLSLPVALVLLALLYAWAKKRMKQEKESEKQQDIEAMQKELKDLEKISR